MNEETNTLMAKFYLGETSPRDFSDWAVLLLENGLDSKNIRILASSFNAKSFSEVEDYFKHSLQDLDWNFPNEEDCLLEYSKEIAKKIVENKIEPYEGCSQIYKVCYSLENSSKLSNWIYLNEGLDPETYVFLWDSYRDTEVSQLLKDAIKKEAKDLLSENYFNRSKQKASFLEDKNNESFFRKLWKRFF